jgi:hypothetical protein
MIKWEKSENSVTFYPRFFANGPGAWANVARSVNAGPAVGNAEFMPSTLRDILDQA